MIHRLIDLLRCHRYQLLDQPSRWRRIRNYIKTPFAQAEGFFRRIGCSLGSRPALPQSQASRAKHASPAEGSKSRTTKRLPEAETETIDSTSKSHAGEGGSLCDTAESYDTALDFIMEEADNPPQDPLENNSVFNLVWIALHFVSELVEAGKHVAHLDWYWDVRLTAIKVGPIT